MSTTVNTAALIVVILCWSSFGQSERYVDLSHPLNEDTIYWPGYPKFNRTSLWRGKTDSGIWYEAGAFSSGEHGGTHVDSPVHFFYGGLDLKDFPLERTIAEGVLVDCSQEAGREVEYIVTVDKLLQWERENGEIPNEAGVLLYFNYAHKFTDPAAYFNTPDWLNVQELRYPYVSAEAAEWLVNNRAIKMLGSDTASPDKAQIPEYPVHVTLSANNVMILENVNIPASFPARDFRLYAPPIRIENGTGVQTRIFAMVYDHMNGQAVRVWSSGQFVLLAVTGLIVVHLFYT